MDIIIRPEKVSDYNSIADLDYTSLAKQKPSDFKSEPMLTAVLRHNQFFDPELAIVAETVNKVIGHALFSPFEFIVMGERKKVVFLAPLCVDTLFQRKGVGGSLLDAGHKIAERKGYAMSVLCGHENYYPRFGYLNRMFALSGTNLHLNTDKYQDIGINETQVMPDDLSWVIGLWENTHKNDRLALYPGSNISQWFNHSQTYRSSVFKLKDKIIGYVKYRLSDPIKVTECLIKDDLGIPILSYILQKHYNRTDGDFIFSLSYEAVMQKVKENKAVKISQKIWTHNAFMIKVLNLQDAALNRYLIEAKKDDRNIGIISFPVLLDIDN